MLDLHVTSSQMTRIFQGEGSTPEIESVAAHIVTCRNCWAVAAGAIGAQEAAGLAPSTQGPLKGIVELIKLEQQAIGEELASRSAWLELRGLTERARRDKLRQARILHNKAMVETLLREAKAGSPKESEELAQLGLIVARQLSDSSAEWKADLAAECCAEIANARRRLANWDGAKEYLRRGREFLSSGSGAPSLEGHLLSVTAALEADLGNVSEASDLLREAVGLFERAANWHLVGRTLVQHAYILADADNCDAALSLARRALAILPPSSVRLILFAENIRVNCLLGLGATGEALIRFRELSTLHEQFPDAFLDLRRRFMAARILEGLGQLRRAEKLFLDVIADDLEQGLVKDFFLDLVYLFGVYLRRGQIEGALALCRRAERDIQFLEEREETSKVACEQMNVVWNSLEVGLKRGVVGAGVLTSLREYVKDHWQIPAPELPSFARDLPR